LEPSVRQSKNYAAAQSARPLGFGAVKIGAGETGFQAGGARHRQTEKARQKPSCLESNRLPKAKYFCAGASPQLKEAIMQRRSIFRFRGIGKFFSLFIVEFFCANRPRFA
jgi:hypothetical protein